MALSTLTLMVLMSILEYRSSQILLEQFSSREQFASYMGLLDGLSNLFVLPMLLFGISRLIARIGLDNTSLAFPGINLVVSLTLVRWPGLASASAAYFNRKALRTSLQQPVDGLLYNAVPLRVKGRARAFVGGLVVPIGSLIGGLLLFPPFSKIMWFIPLILGLLSVAYLGCAFIIRKNYSQALIKLLEQEDYTFLLNQEASDFPPADPATMGSLQKKLETASSHEIRVFMTKLISQIGGNQAMIILEPALRSAEEPRTRSAMIDTIAAAELRHEKLKDLYLDLLIDPNSIVRQSAVLALKNAYPTDPVYQRRLLEVVHDPDPQVSSQALAALADQSDIYTSLEAVQALDRLICNENPGVRAQGIQILGKIRHPRAIYQLCEFLGDPDDQVRLASAKALEEVSRDSLASYKDPNLAPTVIANTISVARDPVERVRQAALVILGNLGSQSSRQTLVNGLSDPSELVRNTAVEMLAHSGNAIIPLLQPELESSDPLMRKMAAVTLSRINPRQYGAVIVGTSITGNLLTIYRNYGMSQSLAEYKTRRSIGILTSRAGRSESQVSERTYLFAQCNSRPASCQCDW